MHGINTYLKHRPPNEKENVVSELSREDGRKRIEQEDNLINHRVSWLIGSQSFLLTAFVLLRNNPSYYPGSQAQVKLTLAYLEQISLLVYVIIFAGFLIALCSSLGVFAAFVAISSWRKKVKQEEREFLTSDASLAHLGGLAAVLPGPVLASIWVMLCIAEWPSLSKYLTNWYLATPLVIAAITFSLWIWYTLATYRVKLSSESG
jgi:hypothetical protein